MQDTRAILASFIGATYGEVKQLDNHIVGQSTTLGKRSDEVKKVFDEVMSSNTLAQQTIPVAAPQPTQVVSVQPTYTQVEQVQNVPTVYLQNVAPAVKSDDNQLWLDLTEKDKIYETLDRLEDKLNTIIKLLKTTK